MDLAHEIVRGLEETVHLVVAIEEIWDHMRSQTTRRQMLAALGPQVRESIKELGFDEAKRIVIPLMLKEAQRDVMKTLRKEGVSYRQSSREAYAEQATEAFHELLLWVFDQCSR